VRKLWFPLGRGHSSPFLSPTLVGQTPGPPLRWCRPARGGRSAAKRKLSAVSDVHGHRPKHARSGAITSCRSSSRSTASCRTSSCAKDEIPGAGTPTRPREGSTADTLIQFSCPRGAGPWRRGGPGGAASGSPSSGSGGRGPRGWTAARWRTRPRWTRPSHHRGQTGLCAADAGDVSPRRFPSVPLTFKYASVGEAPEGKADILDVAGPRQTSSMRFRRPT